MTTAQDSAVMSGNGERPALDEGGITDGLRLDELQAELAAVRADLDDLTAAVAPGLQAGLYGSSSIPSSPDGAAGRNGETSHDGDARDDGEIRSDGETGDRSSSTVGGAPAFPSVDAWVDGYFMVVFPRPVGGEHRWCARWREHPEALTRFEALWRSWETLRLDPGLGIATWLTSFLDPQFAALTSRSGTFAACTPDRHVGRAS